MEQVFDAKQIDMLEQKLDPRLVSTRQGGGGTSLKYIEGHTIIDQANRLFSYGNWASRTLSCEQAVLIDPATGEPVGIAYKAKVELTVRGAVAPIVEVGSQPVTAWNVNDVVMSRRKKGDTSEIKEWEKVNARRTIVESHEMAEKGAVTDAMKRALRVYGNQFGNSLYGDGRVDLPDAIELRPQGNSSGVQNGASNHSTTENAKGVARSQADSNAVTNLSDIPSVRMLRETAATLNIKWETVLDGAFERSIKDGKITREALLKLGNELSPDSCKRIAVYLQSKQAA